MVPQLLSRILYIYTNNEICSFSLNAINPFSFANDSHIHEEGYGLFKITLRFLVAEWRAGENVENSYCKCVYELSWCRGNLARGPLKEQARFLVSRSLTLAVPSTMNAFFDDIPCSPKKKIT